MPEQTSGNPGNATRLARPTAPLALRYGLALVSVAVALGLARTYLYFQLPPPFTALSLSAIAITFWYGGTEPGILAALLATAIRTSFFEPQVRSVSRAVYDVVFLLFALLVTQLGRARNELEVTVAERTADLNRANEDVKLEIAERTRGEETLQRLSGDLLLSQDQERRRIARDLHDATAQNLASLKLALGQIDRSISPSSVATHQLISESQLLVEQSIQELRTLSYVLHPPMLDESGLEAAIRHYIEGFARRSGIRVDLESSTSFGRLKPEFELALFRVIQESLTNIQRHSGAIQAKIRLERETNEVILEISDMGNAISAVALPFEIGVGISSMQERVRQIGGRLAIESVGLGTKIRVTLPTGG